MRRLTFLLQLCALLSASVAPQPSLAADDQIILDARPWPAMRLPCTDAVVYQVQPRLTSDSEKTFTKAEFIDSGVMVTFKLPKGYRFFNSRYDITPSVVHYQQQPQNDLMMSERPGDRVQVCLIGTPVPEYSTTEKKWICNPDIDARGYSFRVYDYKRHATYDGGNSEHSCGGA